MNILVERIEVGGRTLAIERPPDAEALIDEEAFERDEFLPYWAELWPSGVVLAQELARRELRGRHVLELGCGLGIPSVAAALAGAEVLATDWSLDALAFTRRNAERNGAALATATLDWRAPGRWPRRDPSPARQLVLAADVLYEPAHPQLLLALLDRLAPAAALVADPARPYARPFLEAAAARWRVDTVVESEKPLVRVYELSRR